MIEKNINKDEINKMYNDIADELNISDSVFESANRSYHALGLYLSNNIKDYKVEIFPQGSMNLGTLIKPISDKDDYDLDAVCKVNYDFESPGELKNLIGDTLKKSDMYSKLLDPEEGKRCWTLKYADNAQFHMDILPSVPNNDAKNKSIKITHKEGDLYKFITSSPEDYADWFKNLQEREYKILLEKYSADVADLKKFNKRTTLQKTIQILKRHRDVKYANIPEVERENKPISIIITTLVGKMYTGNETILDLIEKFVCNYHNYITVNSKGCYVIENPINSEENFADKWNIYPERKDAFYKWIEELKYDLITNNFMLFSDLVDKSKVLKKVFGENLVKSVFEKKTLSNNEKYIKNNDVATLISEETNIPVKGHTFYGK